MEKKQSNSIDDQKDLSKEILDSKGSYMLLRKTIEKNHDESFIFN